MSTSVGIFTTMFHKLFDFMDQTEVIVDSGITYLTMWLGMILMAFGVSLLFVFIHRHG